MSDTESSVLEIFDDREREYLRRRAIDRESTIEAELRELVRREMENAGGDPLDNIVGMCRGDGAVSGTNFHEYLYGREADD